jgi:SWI/SNF-related matrix-associated actin-dependent regulator 1 of chromatin subfamily A
MTPDISTLADWSAPKEVQTEYGPRILRTAAPTERFSAAWNNGSKEVLKAAGASFSKDKRSGEWRLTWWQKLDSSTIEKREAAKDASRQADSDFRPPAPEGMEYLPFQRAGVRYVLDTLSAGRGCLIADEMGLGKTIQAIGTINALPDVRKVVIICPNTLKLNWRNELRKWLTRRLKISVQNAGEEWVGDYADVVVINYDIVSKFPQLQATQWDLRILDESHFVKNSKAQRTKSTLSIPAKRKLALTGTPILNRPIELHTTLKDLDPATWGNVFGFAKRYCDAKQNGYGWDFSGASNVEELQDRLRSTIMVRRLKKDVLTELPAKRRQVIELPVNGASRLVAAEEREWAVKEAALDVLRARAELAKASDNPDDYRAAVEALREGQGAAFAEMAKLRHDIGMAKLPKVVEFCKDAEESGKLVIFAHHLDVVAGLVAEFPGAAVVTGETAADKRQGEVERFQNDPACRVFVGNLAAAEGLTLTASAHVVFAEGQWVPGKLAQMEDRTHRIGQTNSVLVSYLVLEGSLDARMMQACVDKLDVIDRALDRAHDAIEYATAPVPRAKDGTKPVSEKRETLVKISETLTEETIAAVHAGLRQLADCDQDRASALNGVGFNKIDGQIGHDLAGRPSLTKLQAALGMVLCRKYRRQLGDGVWTKSE